MDTGRLIFRHAILSILFVGLHLALNQPSVILISHLGSVAWYPAAGLVLALLLGISPWYALLVCVADAMAGAMIYHQPLTSFGETVGSVGVAASYGTAAYLLRGPLRIDLGLRGRRDVVRYVFVTMATAVAATMIGVTCLAADKSIAWSEFWISSWGWFSGDGIGLLGIAPFLLIHVFPWVRRQVLPKRDRAIQENEDPQKPAVSFDLASVAEAVGQAAAILVVLWVMFGSRLGSRQLFYLSFVPIIWIAMRQGIRRVVIGLLALNFGMVVAMHIFPPVGDVPSKIGLLMLVVSGVGLIVGAAVSERHGIALDLQEQTAHLNSLIENSPFGIVVLDQQGRVELTNAAFDRLFAFNHHELVGSDLSRIYVPDAPSESTPSIEKVLAGETLHTTARRRRKDGHILDLEVHAVPLAVDGRVRGSYTIYKDISEQIRASQAERKHAEVLSQLVTELQVRTKQMTLLSEMGDLLECCGNTQEACAVVAQSVQKLLPEALCGALYLFRSSRNQVETAVRWGGASVSEAVFSPDACWSLRRGQPHWNESRSGASTARTWPRAQDTNACACPWLDRETRWASCISNLPRMTGPGPIPAPRACRTLNSGWPPQSRDKSLFHWPACGCAKTLRDQSIRDPLTGLFNRRFMEESLEREMQRAVRKNHPVSVLFIDLDHFKRFNDTFGHDAGDLVLRSVADLFRKIFPGGRRDLPLWRRGIRHYPARIFRGERRHSRQRIARSRKETGNTVQESHCRNGHSLRWRGHLSRAWGQFGGAAESRGPMSVSVEGGGTGPGDGGYRPAMTLATLAEKTCVAPA